MGWVRQRTTRGGRTRYIALYRDRRGRIQSAGTWATEKQAVKAWHDAEGTKLRGNGGRKAFSEYVEADWLPHHVIEWTTSDDYRYRIPKYLTSYFGGMRLGDILPADVREWVTWMQTTHKVKPATLRKVMNILSAIFSTAFNDELIDLHPCKGVKLPPIPKKQFRVVTPEQFEVLIRHVPARMRLLVETDIETGARWGELTELRVQDWNPQSRSFTISRAVVEVTPKHHDGQRFRVKNYPKDKETRVVNVSVELATRIDDHITTHHLTTDDLLFLFPHEEPGINARDTSALGYTTPNQKGRRYRHGTTSAYGAGKCRCQPCRDAVAAYRRTRRVEGKDCTDAPRSRRRTVNTDGHIPNSWFRRHAWLPALKAAGIDTTLRPHDLRHAHASWLIAGGTDIQTVKQRLGHANLATTQKYIHTLTPTDQTAITALDKVRNRGNSALAPQRTGNDSPAQPAAATPEQLLAELARIQAALSTALTPQAGAG